MRICVSVCVCVCVSVCHSSTFFTNDPNSSTPMLATPTTGLALCKKAYVLSKSACALCKNAYVLSKSACALCKTAYMLGTKT